MSLEYSYYRPTTPPSARLEQFEGSGHSRTTSNSSVYSNDSSPWSVVTSATSPSTSSPPRHQHGPALLPKIRPQDIVIEPVSAGGPQRHRRVLSNTRNPPGFVPYPSSRPPIQRGVIDSGDCLGLVSPVSTTPMFGSCHGSTLSSPVSITPSHKRKASGGHSRSGSASSIDEATLSRFGYPTYRQLPKYISQPQGSPTAPATPSILAYPSYPQLPAVDLSQRIQLLSQNQAAPVATTPQYAYVRTQRAQLSPASITNHTDEVVPSSTTLLSYLTAPTQAINLVRNVNVVPTRGLHDYFWWDIRNLRSWSSFSLSTFDSINGLTKLLKTEISSIWTPSTVVSTSRLAPDSETALVNVIRDIYAPRVNAALAVSQGAEHLSLYPAPDVRTAGNKNYGGPHFLANYASDTEHTSSGSPRGRLVGIVKSFDRWNTGMRNEAPHRRVEYLNGLAHLQRCMREHSCRYGFIMTEIELVCVRAGCDQGDDVPYFGFLEVAAPIPTKTSSSTFEMTLGLGGESQIGSPAPSRDSSRSASPAESYSALELEALNVPMTASLALYFLLMLSKSVPLPSQPSAHLNVGGPGALTRQRVLPDGKDKWIPEPQIGERRDAKRVRGWVWPQDAWHRREGGGAPRSKANAADARTKKWHK